MFWLLKLASITMGQALQYMSFSIWRVRTMKLPKVFFVRIYRENARVRNDWTRATSPRECLKLTLRVPKVRAKKFRPFLVQPLWRFPRLISHFLGKSSREGCQNERFKQEMCERNKKLFWKGTSPKISSHTWLLLTVSLTKPYSRSRAPKGKVTNSEWFESMRFENPSRKLSAMETPSNAQAHERVVFGAPWS